MLTLPAHPLLDVAAFVTTFPAPLGELQGSDALRGLLSDKASAPFRSDDAVRSAVRDLLRHGGYKPTGRGKPASEYLIRAAEGDRSRPSTRPWTRATPCRCTPACPSA